MTDLREILTPAALSRAALGWLAFGALILAAPLLESPVPAPMLITALVVIIAVILIAAFGVVQQAEKLAHRLGDPYGSLILTLSIVLIEVILIAAVMLGPGEHATIARDSVTAVMMIILNLVIGACLLVGGLRHGGLRPNRTGTSTYVTMIAVLVVLAFVLPSIAGVDGAYAPAQQIPIVILTIALYAWFLYRQTGAQASDYTEVDEGPAAATPSEQRPAIGVILRTHRTEILTRLALLIVTVVPIVLLSHDMAALLDDGLGRLGAPVALAGVLIALIVFTPESITAIRAALGGEVQRVINLCLGAFVSTVGLTIPAVLVIGMLTGQHVVLAEDPAVLALIIATVGTTAVTFASPRVTSTHGSVHLALFAVYGILLFS